MGGVALWLTCFPADVVKSRQVGSTFMLYIAHVGIVLQQIQGGKASEVIMKVLKTEGWLQLAHQHKLVVVVGVLGFYKGLTPTLIRTCIASGCLFIAYEYSKKFMHAAL